MRKDVDVYFDLLLSEPPNAVPSTGNNSRRGYNDPLDDKDMALYAQFGKRVLKTGGYIILFITIQYFMRWEDALTKAGFQVMPHPLIFVTDWSTLQTRSSPHFPQRCIDIAIIGRVPGVHPDGFTPDFESSYHLVPTTCVRKFSVIDHVPAVKHKLKYASSKSPVRMEEKNVNMIAELLATFCPEKGHIIDPFAGTMSAALAAMKTERLCTSIESDPICFALAIDRARCMVSQLTNTETCSPRIRKSRRLVSASHLSSVDAVDTSSTVYNATGASSTTEVVSELSKTGDKTVKASMAGVTGSISKIDEVDGHEGLHEISGGDAVLLYMHDEVVGTAVVQSDDKGQPKTTLHGFSLEKNAGNDDNLVAIYRPKFKQDSYDMKYPYECPGQEGTPESLGTTSSAGMYVWDMRAMLTIPA